MCGEIQINFYTDDSWNSKIFGKRTQSGRNVNDFLIIQFDNKNPMVNMLTKNLISKHKLISIKTTHKIVWFLTTFEKLKNFLF